MEKLFDESCNFIESEYRRLGHTLGFRFLLCPKALMSKKTKILFLALNPGGDKDLESLSRFSCEQGSAFFTESWKDKPVGTENLQIQVQKLFQKMCDITQVTLDNRIFADNYVLAAHFIPFRSKCYNSLPNKKESVESGITLWSRIFSCWQPSHIICLGQESYSAACQILKNSGYKVESNWDYPANWGSYKLHISHFIKESTKINVGMLLHLSQFRLFSHPESAPSIDKFMEEMDFKHLHLDS